MTKKTKITEEIFPIDYPHNKKGTEAMPNDITRGTLHVFEREGKSPVFVVFESPENIGPRLSSVTQLMADAMNSVYEQEPKNIKWFEKPLDPKDPENPYEQVRFRQLGAEPDRLGKWVEVGRESVSKEEIEEVMSASLITEPEPRERLKAPDYWTEGKMPKVSIEDVMKALHDYDKEPER